MMFGLLPAPVFPVCGAPNTANGVRQAPIETRTRLMTRKSRWIFISILLKGLMRGLGDHRSCRSLNRTDSANYVDAVGTRLSDVYAGSDGETIDCANYSRNWTLVS